ncbi:peptidase S15 [Dictyobacter alpinus]|uniref:Peptidase S15 n=1 Tax=Dictyobacter alpinus TaxID=2014873 RepID=A0A402BEM8_9CHLR|nr:CocE/NonD family hydrolase [Dictyobacter alpinus]GCE29779.1 peptidase S15 [Dictyobacter alpinus]
MIDDVIFEQDVAIPVRDGALLSANVYRPNIAGGYPVIMTCGPYGKDLHFRDFNPMAYTQIAEHGRYLNWETPNPDWWVPRGYVVVRVDQCGIGSSPGTLDLLSRQQGEDFYDAIEWAANQSWSNGKIGLLGISYYAAIQWQVAAMQPPHLVAMIAWEGFVDLYRDAIRHGGIYSNTFIAAWYARQILPVQHGVTQNFSQETLAANRTNIAEAYKTHVLDDEYYQAYTPDLSQIVTPLLSVANWGGAGLHLRGNIEGYLGASSEYKWLRTIVGNHYVPFYSEEGRAIQERFFGYWLKGHDNGLLAEPRLQLALRRGTNVFWRNENEWPLARTRWTRFYLDAVSYHLSEQVPNIEANVSYAAPQGGVTFLAEPFTVDTEVLGPLVLRLWVSSSTDDLDLFVTIRNLDASGNEIYGIGSIGDRVSVTKGWLRVSQRKLDPQRSTQYRPYHSHDEIQKVVPDQVVPVDIEIWPTSMVFEVGHRLALDIEAHDGDGSGMFLHNDLHDRSPGNLTGTNTISTGGDYHSFLLVPVIPER